MEKTEKEKPAPVVALPDFINAFQILEMRLGCNKTQPEALIEIIYESIHTRFPDRGLKIFKEAMERYISNKLGIKPNIELYGHPPLGEPLIFSCISEVNAKEAEKERNENVIKGNNFENPEHVHMTNQDANTYLSQLCAAYNITPETDPIWFLWREAFVLAYKSGVIFEKITKQRCEQISFEEQGKELERVKVHGLTNGDMREIARTWQQAINQGQTPESLKKAASIKTIKRILTEMI